ncbi:MAG TPA: Cys-tRNA(Pro) deacylase [Firmicutes bacterium]|jgi:Cys-tRNA(Pro)/Cys-tRNA(Cys) deacylase|nr:Cys-tRNA(Pro) deacylase [Bacillota bacterium]HOQ23319.1 Cys-tRNA(Pro) deacylase [Bacillota bacterium]HPT66740.1 Cys-tRNA(Pro) deacylase [Bacillota bacterium]
MSTTPKTNAARILDRMKIPYELKTYEVDPEDLSAETVAAKVGLPLAEVFKTLVLRAADGSILMASIPAGTELDLKALAQAGGYKKVEMVHLKEVQPLTGYIRGGVSPVGTKKKYPYFLDESALTHERISVSAGLRGYQMMLDPRDLLQATGGRAARIARLAE